MTATTGDYNVSQITGAAPLNNPAFTGSITSPSIGGTGVSSFTVGNSNSVGSDASVSCARGHQCDSFSGVFVLNTGASPVTSSGAIVASITMPSARVNLPNCAVTIEDMKRDSHVSSFVEYPDTSTLTISVDSNLRPLASYQITYVCGGN